MVVFSVIVLVIVLLYVRYGRSSDGGVG